MPRLYEADVLERVAHRSHRTAQLRADRQAQLDVLLRRARHLDPAEQHLASLAWAKGATARELGQMMGLNHGSVVRRLQRIKRRLTDPLIVAVLEAGMPLAGVDREIALSHCLRREPLNVVARRLNLPRAVVKKRLDYVRGWVSGRRDGVRVARAVMQAAGDH